MILPQLRGESLVQLLKLSETGPTLGVFEVKLSDSFGNLVRGFLREFSCKQLKFRLGFSLNLF
jgi:hypothetical protein